MFKVSATAVLTTQASRSVQTLAKAGDWL